MLRPGRWPGRGAVSQDLRQQMKRHRFSSLALAAMAAIAGLTASMSPVPTAAESRPDVRYVPPDEAEGAVAYWDGERMGRARVMRPIQLDPVTMKPVDQQGA